MMTLVDILGADAVVSPLKAQSKKRLMQEIAQSAALRFGVDETTVLSVLLERESLGPTGVGRGVAIPHARLAGLERVHGLFFRLEAPVDFGSVDRKPVDLVFVLFAPEAAGAVHLKALARVSRLMRSESICAKLRSTTDPQAVYSILIEEEASEAA